MSEKQTADITSEDVGESRADDESAASAVPQPFEGKDKRTTASAASSGQLRKSKEKRIPMSFRRASVEKSPKSQALDSGKSPRPTLSKPPPTTTKPDRIPPKTSAKKGLELGAVQKTPVAKAGRQSGTAPGLYQTAEKKVSGKSVDETTRIGKDSEMKQSPKKVKPTTARKSKSAKDFDAGKGRPSPYSETIKLSDTSKYTGVEDSGVIVKSSHSKSRKDLETGQLKKFDKSTPPKAKATVSEPTSEPMEETKSPASLHIRNLCVDFVDYKRDHFNRQRSLETNMRMTYPKMLDMLQEGEVISKRIGRIPQQVPSDETRLRVENDRLNYLITTSAAVFKRIVEQFAHFKKEVDSYTSCITETNVGIDVRLQKVLTAVCEVSILGSEVKCD